MNVFSDGLTSSWNKWNANNKWLFTVTDMKWNLWCILGKKLCTDWNYTTSIYNSPFAISSPPWLLLLCLVSFDFRFILTGDIKLDLLLWWKIFHDANTGLLAPTVCVSVMKAVLCGRDFHVLKTRQTENLVIRWKTQYAKTALANWEEGGWAKEDFETCLHSWSFFFFFKKASACLRNAVKSLFSKTQVSLTSRRSR